MRKLSDFYKSGVSREELVKRVSSLTFVEIDEGVYSILGSADFSSLGLNSLLEIVDVLKELAGSKAPVRIGKVYGSFDCNNNHLTDLQGAPEWVEGDFVCKFNQLVTLEGAPKYVGRNFYCWNNQLISLEGAPRRVGGDFACSFNNLQTLQGAPEYVGGYFDCGWNRLKTLEGAPKYVGKNFYCDWNKLISLEGAPEYVGRDFSCHENPRKFTEEEVRKLINVGGKVYVQNGS
jgi:hypothetical protein